MTLPIPGAPDVRSFGAHPSVPRLLGRLVLAAFLTFTGVGHLSFLRKPFRAQVPDTLPAPKDPVVLWSGVVELAFAAALVLPIGPKKPLGWILAAFFVAILPGNISQTVHHRDALGLDSDAKRDIRLLGQPVLIALALWSTGARRSGRG